MVLYYKMSLSFWDGVPGRGGSQPRPQLGHGLPRRRYTGPLAGQSCGTVPHIARCGR